MQAVLSPSSLSSLPQNALPMELIPGANSPGKLDLPTPSERGQTSVLLEYNRIKADEVVGTRAGVTQNDLPTLLAHLTVILVICLVAVNLLLPSQ